MARVHYFVFQYAPGMTRIASGGTVQEACKTAFGCVYDSQSNVKYKDVGTQSPAHLSATLKHQLQVGPGWLDMPERQVFGEDPLMRE